MDAGLLPVKNLARSKGRLAADFNAGERAAIARALLEDALALCGRVQQLAWWVVSDDDEVLEAAAAAGFGALKDGGGGLNPALERALDMLIRVGAGSVAIVPVDVPLATDTEITDLLDTGATSDAVLVPSAHDGGTNGLYMQPPGVIEPSFGRASLAAHLRIAQRRSLRCSILELPGLGLDIDRVEDVEKLLEHPGAPATSTGRLLAELRPRPAQAAPARPS